MDVKRVENFFSLLESTDINELCLEKDDMKLRLKRGAMMAAPAAAQQPQSKPNGNGNNGTGNGNGKHTTNGKHGNGDAQATPVSPATSQSTEEQNGCVATSKMVGTFYRSSDTLGKPWVEEGDEIKKGQKLGVIEAMKIMKEVVSECDGILVKVLVGNGKAVEYGTEMFLISEEKEGCSKKF